MSPIDTLKIRLQSGEKILLAGACGTEIQRRGVRTELPLWSASANETHPHVVRELHKDYIDAGAEIITTNTFRTNLRTLRKIDQPEKARELTLEACRLAKEARGESRRAEVVIGGSLAPVEDCYEVNLVPSDEELREEHSAWARDLADGGADFLFVETMNCIREAVAATRASRETGLDVAVSFVCNKKGDLLSGESIESAVQAVLPFEPFAILTNCRPLDEIETSVQRLLRCSSVPVGVYANGAGHPDEKLGWKFEGEHPEEKYLEHAKRWIDEGVQLIGGCCGTTPIYIEMMNRALQKWREHCAQPLP